MKKITLLQIQILVISLFLFLTQGLFCQNTVITDNPVYTADPSAMLDVNSADKGFLVPRLNTVQMGAITSPANGLLVFNTDLNSFCYRAGGKWIVLASQLVPQSAGVGDALFNVVNASGDTVFAVYPEGVRINVGDGLTKGSGNKGGFAVGGFADGKSGLSEFFRVTPDSVRIYIDTAKTKGSGNKGGFAVGGFSGGKTGLIRDLLRVSQDSVRIYIEKPTLKGSGNKGGFAVGGFADGKLIPKKYLAVSSDSTRIYVNDTVAGFAVGSNTSTQPENFLDFSKNNYSIGHRSGDSITTGRFNIFYGYEAGASTKSGNGNAFFGYQSGYKNLTGNKNVFIGWASGFNNISGNENIFMGFSAGNKNVNGFKNVFIGYKAGEANVGGIDEEGSFNVMIGNFCGFKNTSGGSNTFLGYEAGRENLSGYHNTYIGRWAGMNMTTGHHNVFIGTEAGRFEASGANYRLHINAYSSESPVTSLIYGEFDNKLVRINGDFEISNFLCTNKEEQMNVADGATLSPTTSFLRISTSLPNPTITVNISNGTRTGQVLIIECARPSNTITLNDSGNLRLSGNAVLGLNDSLFLVWNGFAWVQFAKSDN